MRRVIITITTILLPSLVFARTSTQMSLQECIDYALKNQVKMKNALLDQQTALSQNKGVVGQALPQLRLAGNLTYAPLVPALEVPNFIKGGIAGDPITGQPGLVSSQYLDQDVVNATPNTIPFAFQPRWTTNPVAELNQILFDPGITVALQARKKLEELAAKTVSLTREQLIVEVTKAYYNILVAEKRMGLLTANLEKIQKLQQETQEVYNNGLAEQLDVDRITVTLNNLKTDDIKAKQFVALAYLQLKFQIGMQLQEAVTLTDTLSEDLIGKDLLNDNFDYTNRKEYQLQEIRLTLLNYDLKRWRLSSLPSLNMFGNYGYTLYNSDRLFDPADKWQKSALIGVKLSIPVFDGFQRKQKVRQAKIQVEKTENDIENLKSALELSKENARISLESNLRSLQNQKSNMALAERVYNTAQIKYNEGVGSSLEVVNAQSDYKVAQTNYFTALYDAINSGIDMQQSLGLIK